LYIKALEEEVLRLKESFSSVTRDKDNLAEENRQLKHLLAQHGIAWSGTGGVEDLTQMSTAGYSSSGSMSGSYATGSQGLSPAGGNQAYTTATSISPPQGSGRSFAQQQRQLGTDYDQAGIDFVLTYDPSRAYMSPPPQ
jgi:hypothetical protein